MQKAKSDMRIGVIGLGTMGGSMARNMIKNGFRVMGSDLLEENRQKFAEAGGVVAADNSEVGRNCDFIVLSLPSPAALKSITKELVSSCVSGTCIIETSTLALSDKQAAFEEFSAAGISFLDVSLSGNGFQAVTGDLVIYFSGDEVACEACYPVMEACTRCHYYLGAFGSGIKMKLVANYLVTCHNVAGGEAMLFGERLGLDPQTVYDVMCNSAGTSRMFEVRGPLMVQKKYHPASMTNKLMLKDVNLIHNAVKETGIYAPLFEVGYQITKACAEDARYVQEDTAACLAYLEDKSAPAKK